MSSKTFLNSPGRGNTNIFPCVNFSIFFLIMKFDCGLIIIDNNAVNNVNIKAIIRNIFRIRDGGIPAHCMAISSFVLESLVKVIERDIKKDTGMIIRVDSGNDKIMIERKYLMGILKLMSSYIFRNLITTNMDKSPKNIALNKEKNSFKIKAFNFLIILNIVIKKKSYVNDSY